MTTWAWPWAFVLLIPVLLLPMQARWTGRVRLRLPGPDMHRATATPRTLLAWAPLALRMAGLALLVVALARPQEIHRTRVRTSDGLDILLAVDTSGSMRAEDLSLAGRGLDRLEVAKAVMDGFIAARQADRIGVVVFGEEAFTHVPLTLDHDTLRDVLKTLAIGIAGESRTAIGSAIAVAAKRLKDLEAPSKVVILLTDGRSNAGRLQPVEAARLAAALGIKVYTIGIGPPGGRPGLLGLGGDGVDEPTLKEVAEATGAQYFRATNARSLERVFAAIDELEPSPGETEELVDREEHFHAWAALGSLLLALELLLSMTWLRRAP